MRVTLLPSFVGGRGRGRLQYLTTFRVDDEVAIDAGSLGLFGTPQEQAEVKHVFLTHTHADHIASLPVFLLNASKFNPDGVTVHGSAAVLDCLRRDVFNGRVWASVGEINQRKSVLRLSELKPRKAVEVAGLRLTPVPVDHVVPTLGFLIEGKDGAIVIPSDTGPTEEIWRRARGLANLRAVFLEASFPNALRDVAEVTKHLTPALFAEEAKKLNRAVRWLAVHIKADVYSQVVKELRALETPKVEIAEAGKLYEF